MQAHQTETLDFIGTLSAVAKTMSEKEKALLSAKDDKGSGSSYPSTAIRNLYQALTVVSDYLRPDTKKTLSEVRSSLDAIDSKTWVPFVIDDKTLQWSQQYCDALKKVAEHSDPFRSLSFGMRTALSFNGKKAFAAMHNQLADRILSYTNSQAVRAALAANVKIVADYDEKSIPGFYHALNTNFFPELTKLAKELDTPLKEEKDREKFSGDYRRQFANLATQLKKFEDDNAALSKQLEAEQAKLAHGRLPDTLWVSKEDEKKWGLEGKSANPPDNSVIAVNTRNVIAASYEKTLESIRRTQHNLHLIRRDHLASLEEKLAAFEPQHPGRQLEAYQQDLARLATFDNTNASGLDPLQWGEKNENICRNLGLDLLYEAAKKERDAEDRYHRESSEVECSVEINLSLSDILSSLAPSWMTSLFSRHSSSTNTAAATSTHAALSPPSDKARTELRNGINRALDSKRHDLKEKITKLEREKQNEEKKRELQHKQAMEEKQREYNHAFLTARNEFEKELKAITDQASWRDWFFCKANIYNFIYREVKQLLDFIRTGDDYRLYDNDIKRYADEGGLLSRIKVDCDNHKPLAKLALCLDKYKETKPKANHKAPEIVADKLKCLLASCNQRTTFWSFLGFGSLFDTIQQDVTILLNFINNHPKSNENIFHSAKQRIEDYIKSGKKSLNDEQKGFINTFQTTLTSYHEQKWPDKTSQSSLEKHSNLDRHRHSTTACEIANAMPIALQHADSPHNSTDVALSPITVLAPAITIAPAIAAAPATVRATRL
jgi:hypothetical protein